MCDMRCAVKMSVVVCRLENTNMHMTNGKTLMLLHTKAGA